LHIQSQEVNCGDLAFFIFVLHKGTAYLLSHSVKTYKSYRQNRNDHFTQAAIL